MIQARLLLDYYTSYCQRCLKLCNVRIVFYRFDTSKRFEALGSYCDDCIPYVRENLK